MTIIVAIIVGLVVGAVARLFLPGRQDIPLWLTIVLGIVGAVVGNYLATVLGVAVTHGFDWIRHILQVGVAAVLIAAVQPYYSRSLRR